MDYLNLNCDKTISFTDSLEFIEIVLNTVFEKDKLSGKIIYKPEYFDYIYYLMVAKYYGEYEISNDLEKDYQIALSAKSIYKSGKLSIQLSGIRRAIEERIKLKLKELEDTNNIKKSILEILDIVTDKVKDIDFSNFNEIVETLSKIGNTQEIVDTFLKNKFK